MDMGIVLTIAPLLTVLLAAASCGITLASVLISRKTFNSQTQPKIIVYTHSDDDRDGLFMIRIQNIGKDVAEEITFQPECPIPRAMGMSPERPEEPVPIEDGPLVNGMPSLAPGEYRDIIWGQYGGLIKATNHKPINIKYQYRYGREELTGESQLEISSYVGTIINKPHMKDIVKHLNKIDRSFSDSVKELKNIKEILGNR